MRGLPRHIEDNIAEHLVMIAGWFKGEPKITLLVRADIDSSLDGDLVMTNDKLAEAIIALQRRQDLDSESATSQTGGQS